MRFPPANSFKLKSAGTFSAFANLCLGMCLGFVLLLPVHEGLHAVAYRTLGAANVRVVYQWRSLTAYCAADQFVVGRRGLAWVCVAPFAAIDPVLVSAALLGVGEWTVPLAGALQLHVGACSGDFGLLNWLWLRAPKGTLSYDDVTSGRSYFFAPAPVRAEAGAAADGGGANGG